jgi:hypothetical protein
MNPQSHPLPCCNHLRHKAHVLKLTHQIETVGRSSGMKQWTPLTFASRWSVILNPGDTSDDLQAANTFHYTNPICITEKITKMSTRS